MNAVTCVTWIQRGAAKACPDMVELSEEQLEKLIQPNKKSNDDDDDDEEEVELNHDKSRLGKAKGTNSNVKETKNSSAVKDRIIDDYNLDDYSDDDDDKDGALSMAGLSFYSSNNQDPYLAKDCPDSDEEDMTIQSDDNIIAVGKASGDFFSLEAWVYNETESNLYCHHDYILPTCPLTIEWVGFDPGDGSKGNLVAVGSMKSSIELWDLDVVNTLDPAFTLAGMKSKKKSAKKKKLSKEPAKGHTDAVLGLSWNSNQQQILASGSADSTIGIWDLNHGSCVLLEDKHADKVQALQWHPCESQTLLTGSFDKTVKIFDCRQPDGIHKTWTLTGEVEKVLWNRHNPFNFFASTDSGDVFYYDVRAENPVFTLSAHTSAVTGLATSPTISGCLVTTSEDHSVKVWDISQTNPVMVTRKMCKIGSVFCVSSCPDSKLLFCVGGEREMKVINLSSDDSVMAHFFGTGVAGEKQENKSGDHDTAEISTPSATVAEESEVTKPRVKKSDKLKNKSALDKKHKLKKH